MVASFLGTALSTIRPTNTCGLAASITRTPSSRFFALFKRAVYGQFHHVSDAHLHRYLAEADFKYNHRAALGFDDANRADALLRGAKGKRLYYRQPNEAPNA